MDSHLTRDLSDTGQSPPRTTSSRPHPQLGSSQPTGNVPHLHGTSAGPAARARSPGPRAAGAPGGLETPDVGLAATTCLSEVGTLREESPPNHPTQTQLRSGGDEVAEQHPNDVLDAPVSAGDLACRSLPTGCKRHHGQAYAAERKVTARGRTSQPSRRTLPPSCSPWPCTPTPLVLTPDLKYLSVPQDVLAALVLPQGPEGRGRGGLVHGVKHRKGTHFLLLLPQQNLPIVGWRGWGEKSH